MTAKTDLRVYRAQYGFYDRVVAVSSEAEARKLLGSPDVHLYGDQDLGRRIKRRPSVVFRKLHGVKRKYEVR
jgi:hypothetical protein